MNSTRTRQGRLAGELARAWTICSQFGLKVALQKAVAYPTRELQVLADYVRYRDSYPTNLIFVASLAKSGSTWFVDLLSGLPGFHRYQPSKWTASLGREPHEDFYPELIAETRHRLAVVKSHMFATAKNLTALHETDIRYLVTVRDPRDQMISEYWYLRNRSWHPAHERATRLTLRQFISEELEAGAAPGSRISWLQSWIANRDIESSLIVRYEDLLEDPVGQLQLAFDFLAFDVQPGLTASIVDANKFEKKAGRPPGQEDTNSFLRKGVAGEWIHEFTADHRRTCRNTYETVITALGYPPTPL